MDKEKKMPFSKGEEEMPAIPKKEQIDRQSVLDKISSKIPILQAKNGKVKLNPNNPNHRDWFEDK